MLFKSQTEERRESLAEIKGGNNEVSKGKASKSLVTWNCGEEGR